MIKGHFCAHHFIMIKILPKKFFFALVFSLCMEREFNGFYPNFECMGVVMCTPNVSLVVKYSEDNSLLSSEEERLVDG